MCSANDGKKGHKYVTAVVLVIIGLMIFGLVAGGIRSAQANNKSAPIYRIGMEAPTGEVVVFNCVTQEQAPNVRYR